MPFRSAVTQKSAGLCTLPLRCVRPTETHRNPTTRRRPVPKSHPGAAMFISGPCRLPVWLHCVYAEDGGPGTRHGSLGQTGRQGLPASSSLCASIFLQSKWSFACCPASSLASRKVKINHACGHAQNYARRKGMVFGGSIVFRGVSSKV